ncbi:hypothetical protein, partial [Pseudomonas lactucae]|uniref:hypothetical protein n=1 Tax=Pseudomonas lactucae TaxID=2813360 RepID=UPI001968354B
HKPASLPVYPPNQYRIAASVFDGAPDIKIKSQSNSNSNSNRARAGRYLWLSQASPQGIGIVFKKVFTHRQ